VKICPDDIGSALQHAPREVQVEGCESFLFFKPYDWGNARSAKHEVDTYAKIRQADLVYLRTSKLFGLVHSDSGLLLGLLLYYIDCEVSTLQRAVRSTVPLSVRQYWAAEVTETLTRLHESGIVWGDAKSENILVDTQKDPWIVDFRGGYTQGWVEKDLAGTIESDRQGLSKIVDYVFERGRLDII
jgi:serine/threonine protein kinase